MAQKPTLLWAFSKIAYLIVFWAIAAFVLMFAAGYRVNWKAGFLKETGSIYLQTHNRDKIVIKYTLNGQEKTVELPHAISDLQPGHYSLTLDYEGYESWTKSFYVGPSEAKLFNDILFIPTVIKSHEASASQKAQVENEERLVSEGLVIRGNEIYRTDRGTDVLIKRSSNRVDQVFWYTKKTHIIMKNEKSVSIVEIDGSNSTKLFTLEKDLPIKLIVASGGDELIVLQEDKATVYDISLVL